MRRVPAWSLLPMIFILAACQGAPPNVSHQGRACTQRLSDAGQCTVGTIYSFPELSNIR
ncbi:MAG: hypothetical protein JNK47_15260 [Mesorhizobium sp.]|nr:hypothetical protein [Mesorhizobium sp.]MBL8578581.1 hypothetical protein [Mesorhizobium sp.]